MPTPRWLSPVGLVPQTLHLRKPWREARPSVRNWWKWGLPPKWRWSPQISWWRKSAPLDCIAPWLLKTPPFADQTPKATKKIQNKNNQPKNNKVNIPSIKKIAWKPGQGAYRHKGIHANTAAEAPTGKLSFIKPHASSEPTVFTANHSLSAERCTFWTCRNETEQEPSRLFKVSPISHIAHSEVRKRDMWMRKEKSGHIMARSQYNHLRWPPIMRKQATSLVTSINPNKHTLKLLAAYTIAEMKTRFINSDVANNSVFQATSPKHVDWFLSSWINTLRFSHWLKYCCSPTFRWLWQKGVEEGREHEALHNHEVVVED